MLKIECSGKCGKFQMVREHKVQPDWQYMGCGKCDGWVAIERSLHPVPAGLVLEYGFNVAGSFYGLRLRIATEDDEAGINRARGLIGQPPRPHMLEDQN
jgi:hypothetical protein